MRCPSPTTLGSAESVTSAATAAVEAPPLTASFENAPSSHDGSSNFTFDLRFSEELRVGYRTLRDHAFTVDGGTVRNASRLEPGSNGGWRIEVRPNVNDDVTVVLPVTTDCNDDGAICTGCTSIKRQTKTPATPTRRWRRACCTCTG